MIEMFLPFPVEIRRLCFCSNCLQLFDKLKEMNPDFHKKILPVVGDILEPGLGLSTADVQRLSAEVSIVFHSAATVKFDEPLK